MKRVNRQDVIAAAHAAFNKRFDKELMTVLENRAQEYGEQQQIVDDVNRWWKDMEEANLEKWSKEKTNTWFNEWLSNLP